MSKKLHTNGRGLWSREAKTVGLRKFRVLKSSWDPDEFGEIRAYFDRRNWDIERHGLIYTDDLWLREFRAHLMSLGFSKKAAYDVDYSEQGMQGDDYVSLDIGKKFLREWNA